MPPISRSDAEESDLLDSLFSELDNSTAGLRSPQHKPLSHRSPLPRTPIRAKTSKASQQKSSKKHAAGGPQSPFPVPHPVDFESLVDGAEDWDWDDMNSDFMTPRKSSPVKPKHSRFAVSTQTSKAVSTTRCVVKVVQERAITGHFEKILEVDALPTHDRRRVTLRDDWTHADVRTGDVVNLIGDWTIASESSSSQPQTLTITVCAKHNYFIHHPDILLTATSLSNTSQCSRRPLLANMVRSTSDVTPSLIWGNMLHEVMQTCLSTARWDEKFINKKITEVAQRGLGELLRIDMGVEQAVIEVKSRAKGLKAFAEKYIAQSPKPDAFLANTRAAKGETSLLAIPQLYDIEEDIWSPTYGLKGKIDASVEAVVLDIDDGSTPFARAAPQARKSVSPMPFEIKTGRAVAGMEHRAQTMLYTLLMSERYGTDVPSGLLYYTQSEEVVRVPAARNELRALLVARNDMAGHMMSRLKAKGMIVVPSEKTETEEGQREDLSVDDLESFLPLTIDDNRTCGRCYTLDTCMLYRKAVEGIEDTSSDIADIYALKTGHLTPSQGAFFKKWEALISLEEKDLVRFRKELWTMSADEREEKGRCFSNMVLDLLYQPLEHLKPTSQKEGKIHRLTYRFVKAISGGTSLLSGHIGIGDAVVVSVEPGLLALARGFIVDLAPDSVVLGVDHELDEELILDRLRGRRWGHDLADANVNARTDNKVAFRIDKDELFGGMARIRDNLAQLFYAGADARQLELVVDLGMPRFSEDTDDELVARISATSSHLNENQLLAVRTVMRAQDYALILGMPGTGKTTVIAAIIMELVKAGKTVLLSSYTHSAVDTILSKLDSAEFDILRLGNLDKIHPEVQKYTLAARPLARNIQELEHQVMSPPVVATTCLSIDHPLFSRRTFDYCIVDEASQITLPTCLGPLRFAQKFILVGDHFQLPPLVKNRAARRGGLDVSLFRRLSDAHPEAVVDLTHQYRMNAEIMLLSNKLIYNNRLKCGSDAVASRSLSLPNEKFLQVLHSKSMCCDTSCWLNKLMGESCKAVFVDTDGVPARDSRVGDLVENKIEAQLVHQVTECLLGCGVEQRQIGVISLYRQQLKLLSYLLQDRKELEILTADRSQGRDKDCIIISMVRSNDDGLIGELVKDWRRMNVSFTRARSKLIIIGSRKTLQAAPLLREFFELMDSRGWIMALPPDAHLMHEFGGIMLKKRPAAELIKDSLSERLMGDGGREAKRTKVVGASGESILVGRPLLQDIVNDQK